MLLQPFEHESARSFVCCISHTAPDIRLTRARFPLLLTPHPVHPRARCLVLRPSLRPPPRLSSPPTSFRAGRPLGLLPVLLGAPRGCPKMFFLLKIRACLVRICFVRICLRLFLPIHSQKNHPSSWYPYQTSLFLLKKNRKFLYSGTARKLSQSRRGECSTAHAFVRSLVRTSACSTVHSSVRPSDLPIASQLGRPIVSASSCRDTESFANGFVAPFRLLLIDVCSLDFHSEMASTYLEE